MAAKRGRGRPMGRGVPRVEPDGQVRKSQMVSTYGPGALVDLLDDAVLVSGLDFWKFSTAAGAKVIQEPRLRDDLAERLRRANRPELSIDKAFVEPPAGVHRESERAHGVPVLEFPRHFVCQNADCRALTRADGLPERKGKRYVHDCGRGGKPAPCVPVRFVAACKRGHVDEFPWKNFVHAMRWRHVRGASLTAS